MRRSCTDPKADRYSHLGARGIRVSPRWMKSFAAFMDDMGPRPQRHRLYRIDERGDFEPGNCRWESPEQFGKRMIRAKAVTIDGVSRTIAGWLRHGGFSPGCLYGRLRRGMTMEQALTLPRQPAAWMALRLPFDRLRVAQGRPSSENSVELALA